MKSVIFAIVATIAFAEADSHSPAQEKCHTAETKDMAICKTKFGSAAAKVTCKGKKTKALETCMAAEDVKQKECEAKVEVAEKACMKKAGASHLVLGAAALAISAALF